MAKQKKITRYPCTRKLASGLWQYRKQISRGRPDAYEITNGPFASSEAAWLALQEALRLLREHGPQALAAARPMPTFGDLAERWITRVVPVSCKSSTLTDYQVILRLHLLPVLGGRPVDMITRGDVKALLLDKIAEGYAQSSVVHMKNAISGVLALAVDDELLAVNPALALGKLWKEKPVDQDINPFSADELRQLLAAMQEGWPRYYPLVATLALAGLRAGEALGLRWEDLDWDRGLIHVRRSLSRMEVVTTKSGKSRVVTLAQDLAGILQEHRTAQKREALAQGWGRPPEIVFTTSRGGPVDINVLRRQVWNPAMAKAELPRRRIHDLRHTSVTLRLLAGHDLVAVSKEHGHHSPAFTSDRYFHWIPNERGRAQVNDLAESLGLRG